MLYTYSQEKPKIDLSLIAQENLEYKALKSTFYLVSNEYTIFSKDGNQIFREGHNFFGRTFAIGVLSKDNKLWFPRYVRFPWKHDPNFIDYKEDHTPKCTTFRIRVLEDTIKEDHQIDRMPIDTTKLALWIYPTKLNKGIQFTDELVKQGTLITFYASNPAPEKKGDVTYSVSSLSNLEWNSDGICQVEELPTGNQRIIGGALYQRLISPGKIEWKLAGLYVPLNGKWIIKSFNSLL